VASQQQDYTVIMLHCFYAPLGSQNSNNHSRSIWQTQNQVPALHVAQTVHTYIHVHVYIIIRKYPFYDFTAHMPVATHSVQLRNYCTLQVDSIEGTVSSLKLATLHFLPSPSLPFVHVHVHVHACRYVHII
jgi:hypothetical protein